MGQKLMLSNVRCAFLVLAEPEYFKGVKQKPTDKRRWSATALVSYSSPQVATVIATLQAVAKAEPKWSRKWQDHYEAILSDAKSCCWTDGKRKPDYDGFAGHWALAAHRSEDKQRPMVMDNDKSPIYRPDNTIYEGKGGRIYSGCIVNMQVEIFSYTNTANGLGAALLGIQRVKDGDAFGGGQAPNEGDFEEIAAGADADDLS